MGERILFFSDLHLHPFGSDWRRVDDSLAVLDWIYREAVERQIKKVWFLGDFYHVRGYLYPSVVSRAYNELLKFKDAGIEVALLVGNHDMPYRHTTKHNSVTSLGSVCTIVEQPVVYEGNGWNFYWLPYVEGTDKAKWAVDQIRAEVDPNKKSCLLAHLDLYGAKFHTNIMSTHGLVAEELTKQFDLVLTGHYHTHQKILDNIWYIGSPYQQSYGEIDEDKGFMIFDDGKLEYVKNTFSPRYMHITSEQINEGITNNYVTITINDSSNVVQIRELASQFNPRAVSVKIDRTAVEAERQLVQIKTDAKDVQSLLTEWVNKTANSAIYDIEKLLGYGFSIVREKEEE